MKNVFLVLITLFSLAADAQSTAPRTGTGIFNDHTFRTMTLKSVTVVDTSATDTVRLSLSAYKTFVSVPALTGPVTVQFPSVSGCYLGDEVTFVAVGAGSLVFSGGNFAASYGNSAILTIATRGTITCIFDGTTWLEKCRSIQ